MKLSIRSVAAASVLMLSACTAAQESVYTDLGSESCKKTPDPSDPNDTPYIVCPGVAGYSLIVRRVDAGRKSLDVVDAAGKPSPLRYQETVTRHMYTLDDKVQWRVAMRDGKQIPVALVVRIGAREDNRNPERITKTYVAVAKLTPDSSCVTDIMPEGEKTEAELRSLADSAQQRQCAPPRPPMTERGAFVR